MEFKQFKTTYAGRELTIETGKYCGQTNGSCVVRCGDTAVMVSATMSKQPREGMDFFPLSVDYEEKMFAVGKIPGGFKKREGRASDKAILTSRLIDRPIRPLFPKGIFNDVVVTATALSVDPDISPEPLAMIGSSVALSISDIPWNGPIAGVSVGLVEGKPVINERFDGQTVRFAVNGEGVNSRSIALGVGDDPTNAVNVQINKRNEQVEKELQHVEDLEKQAAKLASVEKENKALKLRLAKIDELHRKDIRAVKEEYQEQIVFLKGELKAWQDWHNK